MSEQTKQQNTTSPAPKGGAHVAKAGSNVSIHAANAAAGAENGTGTPAAGKTPPKRNKYADKMNKKNKRLSKRVRIAIGVAVLVLLVAAGVFLVLMTRGGNDDTANDTAVASYGSIETYVEGSGVTAAKVREELGLDLKGTVTSVLVEVGDEVMAGDDLIEIDPTETRAELETAQEELSQAQSAVSAAQTELSQAQTVLSNAQSKLSRQNVTAPFSGKLIPTDEGTTYPRRPAGERGRSNRLYDRRQQDGIYPAVQFSIC